MDKRNRKATKRYRPSDAKYETVSLTLGAPLVQALEKAVEFEPDKNASRFIEESISSLMKKTKIIELKDDISRSSFYGSFPQKKTFTFSKDFIGMMKASGNMSFFVRSALVQILKITQK